MNKRRQGRMGSQQPPSEGRPSSPSERTRRAAKLRAIRVAARHHFPTADLDELLEQIANGSAKLPD